jgi:hypothetical protein
MKSTLHCCCSFETGLKPTDLIAGGWFGFKTLVVSKKIQETNDITSFIIQNPGGEPLPEFKPGLLMISLSLKYSLTASISLF